ncbi:hypothetical protein HOG17_02885 [Candidatus Peregrinibacteria bacterium]|jgi:hypothetical protein|nr:hypothetical protein [Candidatus Peregrinibacteria bacterium]MBT4148534.1 hypothetical protein [Candidatus Peregrinibacteria bacterium]MBT4366501.1 hypothetical protein [Candidatus Peregrinibacteria bacterium]MBT4456154.1 hypothetical protein [Candidatus Peregrinibacteria bacterium]
MPPKENFDPSREESAENHEGDAEKILKISVDGLVEDGVINQGYANELLQAPAKAAIAEIMFGLSENLGILETQAEDEGREIDQGERARLIREATGRASAHLIRDTLLVKFLRDGKLNEEEAKQYVEMENIAAAAERLMALDNEEENS